MDNNINAGTQVANNHTSIDSTVIDELRSDQSIIGAILGGFLGAVAGAALWAVITGITKYEIGFIAIGVGFLVGVMVRKLGRGFEKYFGYIGAVWSLIGCFAGNIFAVLIMVSNEKNIPLINILPLLKANIIISIVKATFSPADLIFYGIAVYEGYRFSFMTRNEINGKLNAIINSRNI